MVGEAPLSHIPSPWSPFRPLVEGEHAEEVDLRHSDVASLVPTSALAFIKEQAEVNLSGTVLHCSGTVWLSD